MSHTRHVLAFVVTALWVAGAAAQAPDEPLVARLLPYIGDARLQQQLKFTPEQTKTLLEYRKKWADDVRGSRPDEGWDAKFDRVLAVSRAFRSTLSPEQLERANRLATRRIAHEQGFRLTDPPRVDAGRLSAAPLLAGALKLDADQRLLSAERATGFVYLTPAQSAALETFLGPPGEVDWKAEGSSPVAPPAGAPSAPELPRLSALRLQNAPDVRADLKLTTEQIRALDALADSIGTDVPTPNGPRVRSRSEAERLADAVLTPEQRSRLRQLAAQQHGPPASDLFARPDVRRELGVGADQERAIAAVRAEYEAAVTRAACDRDTVEAVTRALAEATAARDRGFRAALTPEQRTRLDEQFGRPFTGRYVTAPAPPVTARPWVTTFGRYDRELSVLSLNRAVQDELNLTPERLKVVKEASRLAPPAEFPYTDDEVGAKSEYVGKTLAALLTPAQQRRFRQIMLQERERHPVGPATRLNAPAAVAYPGVAEAVGLTEAQRASLFAGEFPLDVLTPRQLAAIRAMLGEPFRGPFGTASEFSRPQAPGPRGAVLMELPWSAAALNPAQATTVARALNAFQVAVTRPAAAPRSPFEKRPAAVPSTPADVLDKALADAVTPEQARRLDQLAFQQAVGRDPRAVLTGFDAARLELTREQVEKLFEAEQEWRKVVRAVFAAQLTPDRRRDLFDRLRRRLGDHLLAVLTPGQRATWADLTGEPCPEVRRAMPMFRPPGL